MGPALQNALSEALTNFALHSVPDIVDRHMGELIYAGGDDVLALLPAACALRCAGELVATYQRDWSEDGRLLPGCRATVSAGLAVVHYKEDLRFALQAARDAEKAAKSAGRDCAVCAHLPALGRRLGGGVGLGADGGAADAGR